MYNLLTHKLFIVFISVITFGSCKEKTKPGNNELLWYKYPAKYWNSQSLHIGNGYMGASIMGGVDKEVITLSEKTMWQGGPFRGNWEEIGVNPMSVEKLPEIRKAIVEGDIQKADDMARKYYIGENKLFGNFTAIGDLEIDFGMDTAGVANYRRFLDLSKAISGVTFQSDGIEYTREYFCSYPDKIIGIKLKASKDKALSFSLGMKILQDSFRVVIRENIYELQGFINGNKRPFNVMIKVDTDGETDASSGNKLEVKDAGSATLWIAIATNYAMKHPDYIGEDPSLKNEMTIGAIANRSFEALKSVHVKDYSELYSRTKLHLKGDEKLEALPTNERWQRLKTGGIDQGLKEMTFNLGRYLVISSSRPGTLPANLQGVWNNFKVAPWAGNYQSNINLQEIYWSCGPTGLLECQEAYIDWIQDLSVWGKEIAKRIYGTDGWTSHATGNIWGHATPTDALSWGVYPAGAAWHCQHLWEQFAFGQDTAYLRNTAYPLMKDAAIFYLQNLVGYKDKLILVPAVSAEHGAVLTSEGLLAASSSGGNETKDLYHIPGSSQDTEMIWDLFSNTIAAASILKADADFRQKLQEKIDQLLPLKIGKYGQLQEWDLDIDNPNGHHRHIAHLYAVAPGYQIHPLINQELAQAAKKSLDMRGDGRFLSDDRASGGNWSVAHRMWCWARLLDGERANKIFTQLLAEQGFENLTTYQQADYHWERKDFYKENDSLFCHFQLDASASIPGFMAELLMQSHLGSIDLLPALPGEWSEGRVTGLRARGGYVVDIEWENRELVGCRITARTNKIPVVRLKGVVVDTNKDIRIKFN